MSFNTNDILAANLRTMHKRKFRVGHVPSHYQSSYKADFQKIELSAETIKETWKQVEAKRGKRK